MEVLGTLQAASKGAGAFESLVGDGKESKSGRPGNKQVVVCCSVVYYGSNFIFSIIHIITQSLHS